MNFYGSLLRYTVTHLRNTVVNLDLLPNLELYISKRCTNTNSMTFKISYYVKLIIWFISFLAPLPPGFGFGKQSLRSALTDAPVCASPPRVLHPTAKGMRSTPPYLPTPEKQEGVLVCQKQNSAKPHQFQERFWKVGTANSWCSG